ncbi:hypothetical protein CcaverHIS002_0106950 [Cutaneotrichosporon cavernicola]|uniref:Autophagy-related protein 14 n=1 Tax=Cutaneotrichosporon cavernicola TaxID=279322 RepID=A0AA48HYS4_9TREE|nr:uncharacterized protein CcaverHIS019_0106890 [Cutaneotrichosporon cavernicola]BEI80166.1 hypothetical protein CcaverHIS002_0106950 [Cutaneotrichosporon cavernicola]BEI87971.1 hypothetical protein CcaverHIS019_0106890 [Cutaneotrichosporon cavernicola]
MQCPVCESTRDKLYCAPCLQEGVNGHTAMKHEIEGQVIAAREKAEQLLKGNPGAPGATEWRELRANVAAAEARVAALRARIARTSDDAQRIRVSTSSTGAIRRRRQTLEDAEHAIPTHEDMAARIATVRQQQREVGKRIIQARKVLVREAVDVFGVQRMRGWEIAGLELPPPDLFRVHPSATINAALVHTIHLLSLLTSYLSLTLPFEPIWPFGVHIGRPVMAPNVPLLATKKFREKKHVLWMSSTAPALARSRKGGFTVLKGSALAAVLARSGSKHRSTLTAFALLAHSIAYLAYTQGVGGIGIADASEDDVTEGVLVSATDVLELIALTAESSDLGVRAHEPGTTQTMRHLGFGLDVNKVVESVLAAERARWGGVPDGTEELSEGWDMLEEEKDEQS